jgi:hypothetical protein
LPRTNPCALTCRRHHRQSTSSASSSDVRKRLDPEATGPESARSRLPEPQCPVGAQNRVNVGYTVAAMNQQRRRMWRPEWPLAATPAAMLCFVRLRRVGPVLVNPGAARPIKTPASGARLQCRLACL